MMNTGLLAFEHGVSETNFLPILLKIQFLPEPNPEHMKCFELIMFYDGAFVSHMSSEILLRKANR